MMYWQDIGAGIGIAVALIGGNAWAMKLVIDNAVKSALLEISREYVTKVDFDKHITNCPAQRKEHWNSP